VDLISRMFPPFPVPGFAPNFTAYDSAQWDQVNWYETQELMAQNPRQMVIWVSFTDKSM